MRGLGKPLLHGFCFRFKQWGTAYEAQTLALPISATVLAIVGMHEGTTKQTVTYSQSERKWVGSDSSLYLFYIAICK